MLFGVHPPMIQQNLTLLKLHSTKLLIACQQVSLHKPTIPKPLSNNLEADRRAWADKHPLGRLGTPEDVARAVVWLATDASSFTTGSPLYVDGGLLAQL